MKKLQVLLLFVFIFSISIFAQDKQGYKFEKIYDIEVTSVKDQARSGTCWSFSGLSFLEAEMMRMGKTPVDLSEMFVVRHCYSDKAIKYVRLQGSLNFGPGGAFHDVLYVLEKFGAVPESVYNGLEYGENEHTHGELDATLKNYVDAIIKNPNRKLSTSWHEGFNGILDAYLGKLPENFTFNGKKFTPKSFAKEVVGLNPNDYVQITSFTHHPFYSQFIIEIPDNWLWGSVYNVTLDEMMTIITEAVKNGYTVGWASDVSEKGFSYKNGVAVVPETDIAEMAGSERERWEALTPAEREKRLYSFEEPLKEKTITQEMRQEAFDNYQTTDDHGMHITGMAKDQNGIIYFKVKNSWDTNNIYEGYLYASESFMKYKTLSIMVHKDAIPKDIRKKLGF